MRRLLANIIDWVLFILITLFYLAIVRKPINSLLSDLQTYVPFITIGIGYFILIPMLGIFQTIGYQTMRINIYDAKKIKMKDPSVVAFTFRQLLNWIFVPLFYFIHVLFISTNPGLLVTIFHTLFLLSLIISIVNFISYILVVLNLRKQTFNDSICGHIVKEN